MMAWLYSSYQVWKCKLENNENINNLQAIFFLFCCEENTISDYLCVQSSYSILWIFLIEKKTSRTLLWKSVLLLLIKCECMIFYFIFFFLRKWIILFSFVYTFSVFVFYFHMLLVILKKIHCLILLYMWTRTTLV